MHWLEKNETCEQKQFRITSVIDRVSDDVDIFLVGESAGGSMALSMLDVRPKRIARVVTVCGLNLNVHNVSPRLLRKNPAFGDAVRASENVIARLRSDEKEKIHTIYSRFDPVVTEDNSQITGTRSTVVGFPGHMWSIVLIALFKFDIVRS
jgi:predicted peptidase